MNEGYLRVHRARGNLAIHLVAVPLFWLGSAGLAAAGIVLAGRFAAGAAVLLVLSLALQGRGHRLEEQAPEPFAGPGDLVRRILTEQFWTFPRFLLGGHWSRAWRTRG